MKRLPFLALFVLLLTVACTSRKGDPSGSDSPFDLEADRATLVGSTWQLAEVQGREIEAPERREAAQISFTADGRVTGNTSCNPINGSYVLEEGLRIRFEGMASGLAFCEEVTYERGLLEALGTADNYTLNDGVLYLNKARMAPLAKFVKE